MTLWDIVTGTDIERDLRERTGDPKARYQAGFMPVMNVAGKGISIGAKMFGMSKKTAAPIVSGASKWLTPVTAVGGALAGLGLGSLLGGSKKQQQITNPVQTTITNQNTYTTTDYHPITYQMTHTDINNSQNMINSPGSSQTKKDVLSVATTPTITIPYEQLITPKQDVAPEQKTTPTLSDGTDMTMLAVVAVLGLIGYGYVSKRGKHDK